MSISHFASTVNHPLCEYMDSIPFHKANPHKQKLYFLSGDPSAYGNLGFKMPEQGYEIMRKSIQNPGHHGYTMTSGVPAAREAILKLYKPKTPVTINHVTIQHGVNQGLLVILMSFTNAGDQILVPEIGYPIFQKLAPALGVKVVHYKLKPQSNYEVDIEHLSKLVTAKTQFLFVINPSNPMGTVFSLQHMQDILSFCDEHQIPLVSDEVYHGEVFKGVTFHSFGDVTDDVPVFVLSGVQKTLGVPGWCTSWTVLFDKNNYMLNIWKNISTSGMLFLHSNKFTQLALPELLQKVFLFSQGAMGEVKAIHDELHQKMKGFRGYRPVTASGTFYMAVIVDVTTFKDIKNDIELTQKLLQEQNIALMPLSVFGGDRNGFRLLTCCSRQAYAQLISRLKQFNQRNQKP